MLQRCFFIFFMALSITGCKTEIWRLDFEVPVRLDTSVELSESTRQIKDIYLDAIRSVLLKNNLDPDDFRFRHHQTVEGTIFVSGSRGSIPEEAFAGVVRDFQDVLTARKNAQFLGALEFTEDVSELSRQQRYEFNYRFAMVGSYMYGHPVNAALQQFFGTSFEHETFCIATAEIARTFPVPSVHFPHGNLSGQATTREGGRYLSFPVRLEFAEPALVALLHNESSWTQIGEPQSKGITYMRLEFPVLNPESFLEVNHNNPHALCERQFGALGRPFSLFYGEGLDRLAGFRTL